MPPDSCWRESPPESTPNPALTEYFASTNIARLTHAARLVSARATRASRFRFPEPGPLNANTGILPIAENPFSNSALEGCLDGL